MATEMKLPELGENIEKAVVGSVMVAAGDTIKKDQPVMEVETDKATAEVPSSVEGVIKEVKVKKGDEIRVGQVILTVDSNGKPTRNEAAPKEAAPKRQSHEKTSDKRTAKLDTPAQAPAGRKAPARKAAAAAEAPEPGPGAVLPASPAVRRLARELGVDLDQVRGAGEGGRISLEDVKLHAREALSTAPDVTEAGPAPTGAAVQLPDLARWGKVEREPLQGVRRVTAERMARSWSTVPHVTQFDEADITEVEEIRRSYAAKAQAAGVKLTITAVVLKVAASALKAFPRFNAALDVANKEVVYRRYVNLGVAVDAGHGLLVPVIRDADRKNIMQLAADLKQLSEKARSKKLSVDEMSGAGFTVSNLGGLGTTHFTPIVNWPEAAILGVGRATTRAVHRDGGFVPRLVMPLSISYDHRLIDGAEAARFLRWIAEALEEPLLLALEG